MMVKGRTQKVPQELLHTVPGLVFHRPGLIDAIHDKQNEPRRVDGSRAGRVEAIEWSVGVSYPVLSAVGSVQPFSLRFNFLAYLHDQWIAPKFQRPC